MKPSWWDKDYTDTFKNLLAWLKNDLRYLNPFYAKKKREQELIAKRAAASKAEWMLLDAAQKKFEQTGVKNRGEGGFYRTNSLEEAHNLIQKLAAEQRKWGKQTYGPDNNG